MDTNTPADKMEAQVQLTVAFFPNCCRRLACVCSAGQQLATNTTKTPKTASEASAAGTVSCRRVLPSSRRWSLCACSAEQIIATVATVATVTTVAIAIDRRQRLQIRLRAIDRQQRLQIRLRARAAVDRRQLLWRRPKAA